MHDRSNSFRNRGLENKKKKMLYSYFLYRFSYYLARATSFLCVTDVDGGLLYMSTIKRKDLAGEMRVHCLRF